jgi:hypothetical protein
LRLFKPRQEHDRDLSPESRSLLTILIREIQDELPDVEAVRKNLASWITANNLHPEQVTKTPSGLYSYRVS